MPPSCWLSGQANSLWSISLATVAPSVARSVPHYAVSRPEQNLGAIIEFEINLTRNNHIEVHRIRGVHARILGFQHFGHARQFLPQFAERGSQISRCAFRICLRWYGEKPKTESALRREVARMWRRRPIGRKLNDRFAPPQAVKLKTRKKSERYWRDRRASRTNTDLPDVSCPVTTQRMSIKPLG